MDLIKDIIFFIVFIIIMSFGVTVYACSGVIVMELDRLIQEKRKNKKA